MASVPPSSDWAWMQMSPELSDMEKQLRDNFVREYLTDGNPYKAAIRVGFQAAFAKDYAAKFMNESYVLQQIESVRQRKVPEATLDAYDKNIVRDVLRRTAQDEFAPHAAPTGKPTTPSPAPAHARAICRACAGWQSPPWTSA